MPVFEPRALSELPVELVTEIDGRVAARTLSNTVPVRIWARRPGATTAWIRLLAELHEKALLEERLRELVRLRIAAFTQCQTCQTGRKSDTVSEDEIACLSPTDERFTARERAALEYADRFCADWLAVDDDMYRELGDHFEPDEIVELQMFCAMMLAGGRLAFVQRAWSDDARPTLFP